MKLLRSDFLGYSSPRQCVDHYIEIIFRLTMSGECTADHSPRPPIPPQLRLKKRKLSTINFSRRARINSAPVHPPFNSFDIYSSSDKKVTYGLQAYVCLHPDQPLESRELLA